MSAYDEWAEQVYNQHQARLYRFIRRLALFQLRDLAEDMVQMTFARYFEERGIDRDQDRIWRELKTIANSTVMDYGRRANAAKRTPPKWQPPRVDEFQQPDPLFQDALSKAISSLSDSERNIIGRTLEGYKISQVARMLGEEEHKVRYQYNQIILKLAKMMGDYGPR